MQVRRMGKKTWLFMTGLIFLLVSPSFAQTPPGQFTRYWRNFFESKASWPTLRAEQAQGEFLYGMGVATLVSSTSAVGAVVGLNIMGQVADNLNSALAGVGLNPPEPPRILSVERTAEGVKVTFDDPFNPASTRLYQLIHFENSKGKPRLVDSQSFWIEAGGSSFMIDSNPPMSGTSFYALTVTRTSLNEKSLLMLPWWSVPLSGSNMDYFYWWSGKRFGITSDYSAPGIYNASPAPNLGEIDAVAVSPNVGDIYVSRPGTKQIMRMANTGENLGPENLYISIPYREPGQKGLGIDSRNYLYTDNSASDSQFGGRLFKFTPQTGAMEFTGTVNYFSQMLMFANPVAVGPMAIGPDNDVGLKEDLYVFDAMSREIKRAPVNAAYDVYRRVGLPYFRYDVSDPGNAIDLDVQRALFGGGTLYLLDHFSIKGIPLGQREIPGVSTELIPLR